MKNFLSIITLIFFVSFLAHGAEDFLSKKVTLKEVDRLEKDMEKWVESVEKKDLLAMAEMKQRPAQVEVIKFLFPYLLPEGFAGKTLSMDCIPDFEKFRKAPNINSYETWESCVKSNYRHPQGFMAKALKDLRP